jgi:predicted metallopeptidase
MLKLFILALLTTLLVGDEYDFDMSTLQHEPYEYSGYLRIDNKIQKLNKDNEEYQNYLHLEALFDFAYHYDSITFKSSLMATYDYTKDKLEESDLPVNELYVDAKLNTNHRILVGKESLKWGKGYYFNPVAFFDRPKDPTQPTLTREGFSIAKYSYNKSFSCNLKNLSFDFVYLPSTNNINEDYYRLITGSKDANNLAMRLYLLYLDTDIDLIYSYSDIASDKIGIDFSRNIQVNFEVHGEFAKVIDESYSYLLGIRYLTDFELTIISEYMYKSNGLNKEEIETSSSMLPFLAKDYWITLISQKEPFDWLYLSIYYKNMMNAQDSSQQNKLGVRYSFKNNIDIDLSYNKNSGAKLSEFGKKPITDFVWLQASWKY